MGTKYLSIFQKPIRLKKSLLKTREPATTIAMIDSAGMVIDAPVGKHEPTGTINTELEKASVSMPTSIQPQPLLQPDKKDSILKKDRGVKGISNGDYRIAPNQKKQA